MPNPFFRKPGRPSSAITRLAAAKPDATANSSAENLPAVLDSNPSTSAAKPGWFDSGIFKEKRLPFYKRNKDVEQKLHTLLPTEYERPARLPNRVMSLPDRNMMSLPGKKVISQLQKIRHDGFFEVAAHMAGFYHDRSDPQQRVVPIRDWTPEVVKSPTATAALLQNALRRAATGPKESKTAAGSVAYAARLANAERAAEAHFTPEADMAVVLKAENTRRQRAHHRQQEMTAMENRVQGRRVVAMSREVVARQEAAKERVLAAAKRRQDVGLGRICKVLIFVSNAGATTSALANWAEASTQYQFFKLLFGLVSGARVLYEAESTVRQWEKNWRSRKSWLKEMEERRAADDKARRMKQPIGLGDKLFACVPQLQKISLLPPVEMKACPFSPVPAKTIQRRARYTKSRWEGPHVIGSHNWIPQ